MGAMDTVSAWHRPAPPTVLGLDEVGAVYWPGVSPLSPLLRGYRGDGGIDLKRWALLARVTAVETTALTWTVRYR